MWNADKRREERIARLRYLIQRATAEGQHGGQHGGIRADAIRSEALGRWLNELRKLEA